MDRFSILTERFSRVFAALIALSLVFGGLNSGVQVFAWTTMLVSYSTTDGFVQAAKDTFSGERPCALCQIVAEGDARDAGSPVPAPLNERRPTIPSSPGVWQAEYPDRLAGSREDNAWCILPRPPALIGSAGQTAGAPPTPPPRPSCS